MGLLLDLSPDGGMNDDGNDEELEAELLNLMGGGGGGRSQGKKGEGKGEIYLCKTVSLAHGCSCLIFDVLQDSVTVIYIYFLSMFSSCSYG